MKLDMGMNEDLAFLKSLLSFCINESDDADTKFGKIVSVIYNQLETKKFVLKQAELISNHVDNNLIFAIAVGLMNTEEMFGKEKALNVLERKLREQITSVTGQTNEELDNEVKKAVVFADLMTHGIHIEMQ
jgi:replicative superfamily II helicase